MYRKAIITSIVVLVGMLGGVGTYAADLKVGYVNASRVLEEAPQAKNVREKLEKEFAPRNQELTEAKERLKEMEEKLQRDGAVMSQSQKRKLEREVLAQRREVRRTQEAFREDLNIRRNEELSKLQQEFRQAIQDLAERQGYDLIVGNGVLFASDRVDVTDKVLEVLKGRRTSGGQ